jgi:trehalose 6-phosphate phosphatase
MIHPLEAQMHSAEHALQVNPEPGGGIDAILEALAPVLDHRKLFIGLDRDGTLVPYAQRPDQALVSKDLYDLLGDLAKQPAVRVGIVSARSVAQLRGDFDAKSLFLAGNYGMEICSPKGEFLIQPLALEAVPTLKEVRDRLAVLTPAPINAILEDHGYSLCLHWHTVNAEQRQIVHDTVAELKENFRHVHFQSLQTSYEVKPRMPWTKGSALAQIFLQEQADLANAYPIYAGDSQADEAAFAWVNSHGGTSIKVGAGEFETCSQYQLSDTSHLIALLRRILDKRRNKAK